MNLLQSISKVYSLLIQKRCPVESIVLATKSQSFSANSGNNFSGNGATVKGKEKQVCTHCGKMGHTAYKCYRLHGVPPGFKFKNKNPMAHQVSSSQVQSQD